MNKKYYIETYGCQMNVYDSELVGSLLEECDYTLTQDMSEADAVFLNTCAIREKAEETVHNRLDNLHVLKRTKPNMILGVLGCMAQNLKDDILESRPYVDVILGPDSYRRIPEIIKARQGEMDNFVDTRLSKFEVYDDLFPSRHDGVNAWISIMRGCDKFCTFCIVPFTRGRERSRSIQSVVDETINAVSQGFVEITLLGQNVNSYRTPDGEFPELLKAVAKVEGVKRIRYTSPHPQDIDDALLEVMRDHSNICNYIHLPLQAGSDRILKRMNRTYTQQEFLDLVDKIYEYMPNCSISTDIIVGFPGETEDEFLETLDVVKKVHFDSSFMFKYSSRPGTKAAEYTDQISEDDKQNRLERLIVLQRKNTLSANLRHVGNTLSVMVEKVSKKSDSQWAGRTDGNMWVVFDKTDEQIKDIVNVKIEDAKGITLFGSRIHTEELIHEAA
ncbi:MAG: tRNA (N6-isopentenyl adenosine(37)-C2)-methylthiotransferase MiaB [Candidatus Marinimicrobia bacterium]|nr:tRNA (N6-isopentenyl adenosine(37)-C2)-methylthiotransferase MiaB [Candidatus Neomarinimicrobiota bacterium]MBT5955550.1 tRNA (N6-isopentenyl adenosine(37)-C2)-methylthiotransferase MiaB [Candidatus Neomarinimicrobiota bacterium]MBT7376767.1 tRNA (N6-isopentenyl adenosine(37)-C2)-methylthiotransferase MiaB [Candidatus Neomarinimicrobiota bacterium]